MPVLGHSGPSSVSGGCSRLHLCPHLTARFRLPSDGTFCVFGWITGFLPNFCPTRPVVGGRCNGSALTPPGSRRRFGVPGRGARRAAEAPSAPRSRFSSGRWSGNGRPSWPGPTVKAPSNREAIAGPWQTPRADALDADAKGALRLPLPFRRTEADVGLG